ncbi:MAG: hypothetical protein QXR45_14980 [Candidatus Bathyarchaeia archaeon]
MASALDWEEKEPRFNGDIRTLTEKAVKRLLNSPETELRVEEWRRKPEERLMERRDELLGEIGFLGIDISLSMEVGCDLLNFSAEMRLRDRVAYWVGLHLIEGQASAFMVRRTLSPSLTTRAIISPYLRTPLHLCQLSQRYLSLF